MAITFDEVPDSRSLKGNPPTGRRRYKVVGTTDENLALQYGYGGTPAVWYTALYGALYRQDIEIDPDGWGQWYLSVPYAGRTIEPGQFNMSFDTTGGTARIYCAKAHVSSWNSSGIIATDYYKGAIGVVDDGGSKKAEGCDIIIPALKLTYTLRQPQGIVTESYVKLLASITGKINGAAFRTFAAGELLFAGATGSDGSNSPAEVAFTFIASQHATLTLGDIALFKPGHAFTWVEFTPNVVSGVSVLQPLRVHVEGVYDSTDFASYLGWA